MWTPSILSRVRILVASCSAPHDPRFKFRLRLSSYLTGPASEWGEHNHGPGPRKVAETRTRRGPGSPEPPASCRRVVPEAARRRILKPDSRGAFV